MENIGVCIKRLRKEKHMTLLELSEKSGISQSHISKIERNIYNPSADTISNIAAALGVPVAALIGGNIIKIENDLIKQVEARINKKQIEFDYSLNIFINELIKDKLNSLNEFQIVSIKNNLREDISYHANNRLYHYLDNFKPQELMDDEEE